MALLWFACFQGDLRRVRWCVARGSDINQPDYDGRTALHIAASEGRESITSFLLLQGALCDALDRFNNKPIDDAKREKHRKITRILRMSCESVSQSVNQSVSQSVNQPLNHSTTQSMIRVRVSLTPHHIPHRAKDHAHHVHQPDSRIAVLARRQDHHCESRSNLCRQWHSHRRCACGWCAHKTARFVQVGRVGGGAVLAHSVPQLGVARAQGRVGNQKVLVVPQEARCLDPSRADPVGLFVVHHRWPAIRPRLW
jgi:hypothetical protein